MTPQQRPPVKKRRRLRERLENRIPEKFLSHKGAAINLAAMIPNITTALALCMGLSSVRYALLGRFEMAVFAVIIAAILDALDGRLARMLNSTSRFGAELDSLSDFVSFGVSPAIVIYLKSLHEWQGLGWTACLFYSVCLGLRLARFNTADIEGKHTNWPAQFFMGVPAPACAMLVLTPVAVAADGTLGTFWDSPLFNSIWIVVIGCLAISRIPTLSIKKIYIQPKHIIPIMITVTVLSCGILFEPWLTLAFISTCYLATIPVAIKRFKALATTTSED